MADKDKEKKKKGAAAALIIGGTTAGIALAWLLSRKAEAGNGNGGGDDHEPQPPPPEGMASLSGLATDSQTGEIVPNALVSMDGFEACTDVNGLYVFYAVDPGDYTILVECPFYHPREVNITLAEGENFRDIVIDPILLAGVLVGARTKATNPDLVEPSSSYKSRLLFNGGLLGDDYISNTSSYKNYTINLPINPDTVQKWREMDLYTNRFGVWLWASAWTPAEYPATRCTRVWVEAFREDGSSFVLRPYEGDGWEKVDDEAPDEDASYISYTTSGGMIPYAGRYFLFYFR